MRKAAYTFIIGNYDVLKPPAVVTKGWDYICFTDQGDIQPDGWQVRVAERRIEDAGLDDKRFAMKHMILFHEFLKGYDLSVSVGGQIQIACDLNEFARQNFAPDSDMLISRHPHRDCVYEEAAACKVLGKDDPVVIDRQMQRYREAAYPAHNGLYETGVIARRHDRENLKRMCSNWYQELLRGSARDQLSLNYAIWKSDPIRISEVSSTDLFSGPAPSFMIYPHANSKSPLPFQNHGFFSNGMSFEPVLASLYLSVEGSLQRWPDPRVVEHADSYFAWLNAPSDGDAHRAHATPNISNLAIYLHRIRPDLQSAFPDPLGKDREAFAEWYLTHAPDEYRLSWLRDPGASRSGMTARDRPIGTAPCCSD
ncbi:MAG TPA: glycosyltransferase domain-containing protein [Beijerinckiaceae bacterium]